MPILQPFVDYYYYFHCERHYFECHEIMEDYWKSKPHTKDDIEVGLILLATSQYHYRRGNTRGAQTTLKKAVKLLTMHQTSLYDIGLKNQILPLLRQQLEQMESVPYSRLNLPLTDEAAFALKHCYPDAATIKFKPAYIDYHKTRDRKDIILARAQSLMRDKNPVDDAPDQR